MKRVTFGSTSCAFFEAASIGLAWMGFCRMMAATAPAGVHRADELQIRLVDQGRGLERLARLLLRQLLHRELAQLVLHEREQPLGHL
jgi:hypothetical protein